MVLETQSVQQGLECVFDFSSKLTALENITILENVRKEVNSFSIFESSRTTKINGEKIVKGQPIGMKDGNLIHRGESPEMVLCKILKDISLPNYERIIVIIGNPILKKSLFNLNKSEVNYLGHLSNNAYYIFNEKGFLDLINSFNLKILKKIIIKPHKKDFFSYRPRMIVLAEKI